jgi:hypothetical protein
MQLLERDLVKWRGEAVTRRRGAICNSTAKSEHGILRSNVFRGAKE